jgi:hypothetical protein
MSSASGVTLQISLAPTDLPHARRILPHQLGQWANQVDEVLLTVDLHRSRGRFSDGWSERLPGLRGLIEECCARYPRARSAEVDYSQERRDKLSMAYFGGQPIPTKDWIGGPFYSYFYGLHAARHSYVLHMDSDMLFGGGSPTWTTEAVRLLVARPEVLVCSPLLGPPTADGSLRSQVLEPESLASLAYRSPKLSTRLFLIDMERLRSRLAPLPLLRPPTLHLLQARLDGNPPFALPEEIISYAMAQRDMIRVDFLGAPPGMWSLHPPHRSALFYDRLPELIRQVEIGEVPEGQRGFHNMNGSMIDWSTARRSLPSKVLKHAKLALSRPFQQA